VKVNIDVNATEVQNRPAAVSSAESLDDAVLVMRGVRKHFVRRNGTKVPAVDGVDLEVKPGEFVVLLGPSGCGKTTLLRCIAGLESPDEGSIIVHGEEHYSSAKRRDSPPDKRKLGMIFQSYALWPHMKVAANVAYPLQVRKTPRAEVKARVAEVLQTVGIEELAGQYPGQLSGGQQQRVALARALVSSNGLILFDEPLSNVDAKVREQLRYEILRMQERIGFAAIYVTHDQEEAMELADRVAVLDRGKISQLAAPRDIYDTPANLYVAKFVGVANEVIGKIASVNANGSCVVTTEAGNVEGVLGETDLAVGDEVSVIARPENCRLVPVDAPASKNSWSAEFVTALFKGSSRELVVRATGWGDVRVTFSRSEPTPDEGSPMRLEIPAEWARVYRR
jgi:iron(III) transport system ATP-binding protein